MYIKESVLLEGVILVGFFWRPRFMKKMTNIENEVSWVIGNSLRTGIIHKFKIKKKIVSFFFDRLSAMTPVEKTKALNLWRQKWDAFIQNLLHQFNESGGSVFG